jgi:pyruvate/2-oxoglutarate dehydrogenase complex dihydrolipoamide dehydrogenase (E3) component
LHRLGKPVARLAASFAGGSGNDPAGHDGSGRIAAQRIGVAHRPRDDDAEHDDAARAEEREPANRRSVRAGPIGMTEAEALAAGYRCECRLLGLENVPRGLVNQDTRGAIKLVADRDTGKVLGVHALADGAGDLILAGVYAIKFGLTVNDLATTWAPYLTMSEALKLVAQSFTTPVDQLSCCAA